MDARSTRSYWLFGRLLVGCICSLSLVELTASDAGAGCAFAARSRGLPPRRARQPPPWRPRRPRRLSHPPALLPLNM